MANRKTKIYRSKDLQGDQNPNLTDFEILDLWYDPAIAVDKNNLNLLKANSSFKNWIDSHSIEIDSTIAPIFPLFQPNGQESIVGILKEIGQFSDTIKQRRFDYYLSINSKLTEVEITISSYEQSLNTVIMSLRISRDLEKVSKLESALILSENKLKQLLVNSDICSIIFDESGIIKKMSRSSMALLNYPDSPDIRTQDIKLDDLIHQADQEYFKEIICGEEIKGEQIFLRIKTKDNIYLHIKPLGVVSKVRYQESVENILLFTDVTEHIKSNDILLSTLRRYKTIIDSSPSAVLKVNTDGQIKYANSTAIHMHGISVEELINMNVNELFKLPNQTLSNLLHKKLVIQRKGKGRKILHSVHKLRGEIVTELTYTSIASNDYKGYLLSYLDITEKEIFKTSLQTSRSKLESFIDFSASGIIQLNADLEIEYISKTAKNILNHKNDSYIGNTISTLISDKSLSSFHRLIRDIDKLDQAESDELIEFKSESDINIVQVSGKKLTNQEDSSIILVCNNFSEKVKSELALIEKESNMHTILENSPFAIYAIDRAYNIIFINKIAIQEFKRHLNVSIKLGDNLSIKINDKIFSGWKKTIYSKVFKGESFSKTGPSPSHADIILESKYSALLDAYGNITGCIELSRDITNAKRKEYNLIEREAYLTSILNSSPNAIVVLDSENNITAINPKATAYYKNIHKIQVGKDDNLINIFSKDHFLEIKKIVGRVFKGELTKYLRPATIGGKTRFYEHTFSPVKDKLNAIIGCKLLIQDQTQLLYSEHALMESEIKYKELLELLPGGVLITRENGHILYASNAMKEMVGIPKYGILDKDSYKSFVLQILAARKKVSNILADPYLTKTFRLQITNKSGDNIWLEARSKEIKFKNKNAYLTFLLNITEKVNSERESDLKQKLYEVIIDNSFDGIDIIEYISHENETWSPNLLMRNERMMEFFNSSTKAFYSKEDILKRSPKFQLNGKLSKDIIQEDSKHFTKYGEFVAERQTINKAGKVRNVIVSLKRLKMNNKTLIIRYYKDITDKRLKETQIAESIDQLNSKNKELEKYISSNLNLENFAQIASHDLKSPLRTIRSFAQLLIKDIYEIIPQKNRAYLDIINKSSENMSNLIDDVLSFSKIESEKPNIQKISCKHYINFLLTQIKDEIDESKAEISVKNIPDIIYSDNVKLTQIFHNLIRNSLKFQKKNNIPKIEISADSLPGFWQFNISDNGIGINKKYVGDIFKIFKRLHNKDEFQGSGIGLSTCQKIISMLGGKIWVSSNMEKGSTFSFTLPKKEPTTD